MFAPFAAWLRREGVRFQEDAAIAPHLYFRIGGTVRLLVEPATTAQRGRVLARLVADGLPGLVIGGGSNIAFPDGRVRAAVVLAAGEEPLPPPVLLPGGEAVDVDAGARNQPFLAWCAANGVAGLEFLSGIPGTLGGAAAVNAGAFGRSMADVLLGAEVVGARGAVGRVDAGDFAFRYRDSRFKLGTDALLTLRLRREPGATEAIAARVREHLEYRARRHPSYRLASAGCFFKNPPASGGKASAGKMIEQCGLKGAAAGALAVAEEHANFLVNRGGGTFADLQRLEERIRAAVAARCGVTLEREVIYVSLDGRKY
jgi:UDP-N-acetylmuramate dehydrogenase